MKKLDVYLDRNGDRTDTEYLGTLYQDGRYEGGEDLQRDIEKMINFRGYDLLDEKDWDEIRIRLSGYLTYIIETDV